MVREPPIKKGDFITVSKDADIKLTYKEGSPPKKYLGLHTIWVVDDIYELKSGLINVSTLESPQPGSYCSNVHISGIRKIKPVQRRGRK